MSWTNKGNGGHQGKRMDRQEVRFLSYHHSFCLTFRSRTIQLSTNHLKTDCYFFLRQDLSTDEAEFKHGGERRNQGVYIQQVRENPPPLGAG
jgi:hypothetical protein